MDVGIGLPATIPGVRGSAIVEWAAKADDGPYSSLAVLDRLVYPNFRADGGPCRRRRRNRPGQTDDIHPGWRLCVAELCSQSRRPAWTLYRAAG